MDSFSVKELNYICRLCLQRSKILVEIFKNDESSEEYKDMELIHKISACVSIEISLYSLEPKKICVKCLNHINTWYDFKMSCDVANNSLQKYLHDIEEKNTTVISAMKTTTEDSLLFPEISILSCDTLLEKSMSLQSNISSIVNYFLPSDEKENKTEINNFCQQIEQACDQTSTFVSGPGSPLAKPETTKSKSKRKGYHCELCDRTFSHFSLFLSHDENIHSTEMRKYSCSVCGRLFILEDRLNIHKKLVHRKKTHQCPICDKLFASEKSLDVHSRLHSEKYKCEKCEYVSTSKLYLNQHIMQKHEGINVSFICDICQQKFSQKSSLLRHNKLHSKNHGKCFKCRICCSLFRSHSELKSHKNTHTETSTPEIHKCRTCNKVFSSRKTLITHQKRHQEPQFNCDVCEKNFSSNYDYRIHMETHSDNKNFNCFHCDKKFSFRKTLLNHVKKYYPRVRSDLSL